MCQASCVCNIMFLDIDMELMGSSPSRISLMHGHVLFETCLSLTSANVTLNCYLTHVHHTAVTVLDVQPRTLTLTHPHFVTVGTVFGRLGTSAGTRTVQDTVQRREQQKVRLSICTS
jgi:hypothetical protein